MSKYVLLAIALGLAFLVYLAFTFIKPQTSEPPATSGFIGPKGPPSVIGPSGPPPSSR